MIGLVVVGGSLSAIFLVVSHRYDTTVRNPKYCPSVAGINSVLGTRLDRVSVVDESATLVCDYGQGREGQPVLSVVAAAGTIEILGQPPCNDRPPITISGNSGCDMSGTPGTAPGHPSILISGPKDIAWQFTSYADAITETTLVKLATAVFSAAPNEV